MVNALVLFCAHFFSWWVFLFLFSILRNYTAFVFKFKDCLKISTVSFLLHISIHFLIYGRSFWTP